LRYLDNGGKSDIFNCGYGVGYSVREVITRVQQITKSRFSVLEQGRRPGDPMSVTACSEKIRSKLQWEPRHNDLDLIISSTLAWERKRGASLT